jgi:hypothetical protein
MEDASQLVLIVKATYFSALLNWQLLEAFDFKTLLIAQI